MKLHSVRTNDKFDTNSIPEITDVYCGLGSKISIHLACEEGNELTIFNSLPLWIHEEVKVTKSHTHVFLSPKP